MTRLYLIAGFLLISTTARAAAPDLDRLRAQHHLPSLSAARIVGDQTEIWVSGVRKQGDPTLITRADKFHIGSCTKAMTATLVGLFVERGKLRWDQKLSDFFAVDPSFAGVTVELMLRHRAGMPANLSDELKRGLRPGTPDARFDRKRVVQATLLARARAVPDTDYLYSNVDYVILGAVLEKISGHAWESLMEAELFKPLQMSSCGFGAAGTSQGRPDQPWGHEVVDGKLTPIAPGPAADNPRVFGPAGTVHCSLADWARFIRLHLDGFNAKPGLLLKPETFTKLHSLANPAEDYTPGAWTRVDRGWAGGPTLSHAGSNTMNYADVWIAPRKNAAYIAVTNAANDDARAAADEAIGLLIKLPPVKP